MTWTRGRLVRTHQAAALLCGSLSPPAPPATRPRHGSTSFVSRGHGHGRYMWKRSLHSRLAITSPHRRPPPARPAPPPNTNAPPAGMDGTPPEHLTVSVSVRAARTLTRSRHPDPVAARCAADGSRGRAPGRPPHDRARPVASLCFSRRRRSGRRRPPRCPPGARIV
jgi:hypothetical protein